MNASRRSPLSNFHDMPLWTKQFRISHLKHLLEKFQTHDGFCWAQVRDTGSVGNPVSSEITSIENKRCNLSSQLSPESNLQHPDLGIQRFLYKEGFDRAIGNYWLLVAKWRSSNSVDRVLTTVSRDFRHTLCKKHVIKLKCCSWTPRKQMSQDEELDAWTQL